MQAQKMDFLKPSEENDDTGNEPSLDVLMIKGPNIASPPVIVPDGNIPRAPSVQNVTTSKVNCPQPLNDSSSDASSKKRRYNNHQRVESLFIDFTGKHICLMLYD